MPLDQGRSMNRQREEASRAPRLLSILEVEDCLFSATVPFLVSSLHHWILEGKRFQQVLCLVDLKLCTVGCSWFRQPLNPAAHLVQHRQRLSLRYRKKESGLAVEAGGQCRSRC
ncbi:uncharacterized protein LOC122026152 isoform X3 [Zingiber officinale]|nr:uncharacterized protein LOC122026152 isoform X3 [Zingiber officinale]